MPTYTCDPAIELNGHTFLSFFTNIQRGIIQPHLDRYGLAEVNPEGWYPLQTALDILTAVANDKGSMMNMVAIGVAAAEVSPLPPEILQLSLEKFLFLYEKIYPTRHRNGDPGWVRAEKVAPGHVKMICNVPYPDDIFYGLFYGFASRFLAPGVSRVIEYDTDLPTKEQGGETTIIHVIWEEK